jgi:hypothetical protein
MKLWWIGLSFWLLALPAVAAQDEVASDAEILKKSLEEVIGQPATDELLNCCGNSAFEEYRKTLAPIFAKLRTTSNAQLIKSWVLNIRGALAELTALADMHRRFPDATLWTSKTIEEKYPERYTPDVLAFTTEGDKAILHAVGEVKTGAGSRASRQIEAFLRTLVDDGLRTDAETAIPSRKIFVRTNSEDIPVAKFQDLPSESEAKRNFFYVFRPTKGSNPVMLGTRVQMSLSAKQLIAASINIALRYAPADADRTDTEYSFSETLNGDDDKVHVPPPPADRRKSRVDRRPLPQPETLNEWMAAHKRWPSPTSHDVMERALAEEIATSERMAQIYFNYLTPALRKIPDVLFPLAIYYYDRYGIPRANNANFQNEAELKQFFDEIGGFATFRSRIEEFIAKHPRERGQKQAYSDIVREGARISGPTSDYLYRDRPTPGEAAYYIRQLRDVLISMMGEADGRTIFDRLGEEGQRNYAEKFHPLISKLSFGRVAPDRTTAFIEQMKGELGEVFALGELRKMYPQERIWTSTEIYDRYPFLDAKVDFLAFHIDDNRLVITSLAESKMGRHATTRQFRSFYRTLQAKGVPNVDGRDFKPASIYLRTSEGDIPIREVPAKHFGRGATSAIPITFRPPSDTKASHIGASQNILVSSDDSLRIAQRLVEIYTGRTVPGSLTDQPPRGLAPKPQTPARTAHPPRESRAVTASPKSLRPTLPPPPPKDVLNAWMEEHRRWPSASAVDPVERSLGENLSTYNQKAQFFFYSLPRKLQEIPEILYPVLAFYTEKYDTPPRNRNISFKNEVVLKEIVDSMGGLNALKPMLKPMFGEIHAELRQPGACPARLLEAMEARIRQRQSE